MSDYENGCTITGFLYRLEKSTRRGAGVIQFVLSVLFSLVTMVYLIRREPGERIYQWIDNDNGFYVLSAIATVPFYACLLVEITEGVI